MADDNMKRLAWQAVTTPMSQENLKNAINWSGFVRVNKDVTIQYSAGDAMNTLVKKTFHKGVDNLTTWVPLTLLMERELQEGPVSRLKDYEAPFDKRACQCDNPLQIEIVEHVPARRKREVPESVEVPDLGEEKEPKKKTKTKNSK